MSRFSRKEAESRGWQIVHEDEAGGNYRAEKYYNGVNVNQSASTEGKLMEAIALYEAHLESITPITAPVPTPVDEDGVPVDEAGLAVRSVLTPEGELTDKEWSGRGDGDALLLEDGMEIRGPTEAAASAEAARQEAAADAENEAKAEPEAPSAVQIVTRSADGQPEDVLLVREGETGLADVKARKADESAGIEADRVDAGYGIGPNGPDNPMGGVVSETLVEEPSAEEPVEVRQEAQIDKALELRDEEGKAADKPELAGQVAEAGAEAEQELADEKAEENAEPAQDSPKSTKAAEEFAREQNVDLSQVKGSGEEGKITKPDVESYLEGQNVQE